MSRGNPLRKNPLRTAPEVDLESIHPELEKVSGVSADLRRPIKTEENDIVLDDSSILDYVLKQGRKSSNPKTCYTSVETFWEVKEVLESDRVNVKIPSGFDKIVRSRYEPDQFDIDKEELEERIQFVQRQAEEFDLTDVNPRDDYTKVKNPDLRDDKIAEFSVFSGSILLTYDEDFTEYPGLRYTTPDKIELD